MAAPDVKKNHPQPLQCLGAYAISTAFAALAQPPPRASCWGMV